MQLAATAAAPDSQRPGEAPAHPAPQPASVATVGRRVRGSPAAAGRFLVLQPGSLLLLSHPGAAIPVTWLHPVPLP